MLTRAALLQLLGSSGESAAALRSNGISAWNTVTIKQRLINSCCFTSFLHILLKIKNNFTRSSIMYLNYLLYVLRYFFIINAYYIYTLYYLDTDNDILVTMLR